MFFLQDPLFSIHAISVPDMLVKSEGQNNDKDRVIGDHFYNYKSRMQSTDIAVVMCAINKLSRSTKHRTVFFKLTMKNNKPIWIALK